MKKDFFKAEEIILNNGITLLTVKRNTSLISIHIGIGTGSINETGKLRGISHFIEHMLFKGTNHRSNEELNTDLERLGGEYNAYTDYTSTVYNITALCDELDASLGILSDMVRNAAFPEEEIERERGVILSEIRTSKDDIEEYSFAKTNEVAFRKSPLRYDVIGTESTVKAFKKDQLLSFYKKNYVPNNCFISIVSPYNDEEVQATVMKYFDDWKRGELYKDPIQVEKNIPKVVTTYKGDIEQSTITFLYTFYGLNRLEELALKILNHRLGESANSILFRELREKRGLAYDVFTQLDLTRDVKTLYLFTAVGQESVNEAIQVVNDCINQIADEAVAFDDETIDIMKKVLKTAVASTLEDSEDLGNYVLHQRMDGESIYEFEEDMKNLDIISKEQIYEVARKVLINPTIHILTSEKSGE